MKFANRVLLPFVLSAAMVAAVLGEARAQVTTVNSLPAQYSTYRAGIAALAPAAATTDFFTITGAANKVIRVRKLHCDGVSTAAAANVIQVLKRSTADTAGTSTAPAAVPLNAAIGVAAGATLAAYTANPTLGTIVTGIVATAVLVTIPAASATFETGVTFDFSNQFVFLNTAAQQLALNGVATSFSAGTSLNCDVEWSE